MTNAQKTTIVMYHYVRNMAETAYPDIKGLTINRFVKQMDYIEKHYKVVALEDYLAFLKGEKEIPKNACVLSFDDGFKDHFLNVFPILKKRNWPACFFPLTQPLTEFIVPPVHKAHFLLAKLRGNIFAKEFNQVLRSKFKELVDEFTVDDKEKKQRKYRWDDALTANLKYSIAAMPYLEKSAILNQIFAKYFENEDVFCRELYMSFEEMQEMFKSGMSFGCHTHRHPALSNLGLREQAKEIKDSKDALEKNLETKIKLFSYPYGDFNQTTIEILKEQGYVCALTSDLGINQGRPADPFVLKRLDTNDLPS